jgi:hypothetical protein
MYLHSSQKDSRIIGRSDTIADPVLLMQVQETNCLYNTSAHGMDAPPYSITVPIPIVLCISIRLESWSWPSRRFAHSIQELAGYHRNLLITKGMSCHNEPAVLGAGCCHPAFPCWSSPLMYLRLANQSRRPRAGFLGERI